MRNVTMQVTESFDTGDTREEHGFVEATGRQVPFVRRIPHLPLHEAVFILGGGWMTGMLSGKTSGEYLANHGHESVVVGHEHNNMRHPIKANAKEIKKVAQGIGIKRGRLVGHSKGAADVVLAAPHMPFIVDSVTLVEPALVKHRELPPLLGARVMLGSLGEMWNIEACPMGDKDKDAELALDGLMAYMGRTGVMIAESLKITMGNMHPRIAAIKERKQTDGSVPDLNLILGANDHLYPPASLLRAAKHLPFDNIKVYSGPDASHTGFYTDSGFTGVLLDMHQDEAPFALTS